MTRPTIFQALAFKSGLDPWRIFISARRGRKQDSEVIKAAPRIFVGNFPRRAEKEGRKVKVFKQAGLYNKYEAWRGRRAKRKTKKRSEIL